MSEITITTNQKGFPVLYHKGYRYNKSKNNKSNTHIWRCASNRVYRCNTSVTLDSNNEKILRHPSRHCCEPPVGEEVCVAMNSCKQEVCRRMSPVPKILEEHFEKLRKNGCKQKIPSTKEKQDSMYRARKRFLQCDNIKFATLKDDITVPNVLAENFLICNDREVEEEPILIFCSEVSRKLIQNFGSNVYCGDGTFMSCPEPFQQVYTLHIDLNSHIEVTNIVPVIYVLLPNKTKQTYVRLFQLIKDKLGVNIEEFHADYEEAAILAVKIVYPEVQVSGCHYHMSKAVWKKAKKINFNLSKEYRKMTRLAANLPLLPADRMRECWRSIKQISPKDNNTKKFIKYFEHQWLNKYPLQTISVAYKQHRTNNPVEGWNRRINSRIHRNPSLFNFIYKIKIEAGHSDQKIIDFLQNPCKKSKRRNVDIGFDKQHKKYLRKLKERLITPLNFLRKLIILKLLVNK